MSTDYDDIAHDEYYQESYDEEIVNKALEEISEESVRSYLGVYGDAIDKRINYCIEQTKHMLENKFWGISLTLSAISIEIIIRYMLLRPLLQGAFLSDELAMDLTNRIASGRACEDRKLLPAILKYWGIDINKYKLPDGKGFWNILNDIIWPKRNNFIHQAINITEEDANNALECVFILKNIVLEMANKLGFTLNLTGTWCEINNISKVDGIPFTSRRTFEKNNPFKE